MALLGNYSILHKSPAKYTTGSVGFINRANSNKPGMMRSQNAGGPEATFNSLPAGFFSTKAYFLPKTVGRIVSRPNITVISSGALAGGKPGSASGTAVISNSIDGTMLVYLSSDGSLLIDSSTSLSGIGYVSAPASITIGADSDSTGLGNVISASSIVVGSSLEPTANYYGSANSLVEIIGEAIISGFNQTSASSSVLFGGSSALAGVVGGYTVASFSVNGSGDIAGLASGSSSSTITFSEIITGTLSSSALASSTVTFTGLGDIAGRVLGASSTNISINTLAIIIGALGSQSISSIQITTDSSSAAIGHGKSSGGVVLSGGIHPFAFAYGKASTDVQEVLDANTIASAVWAKVIETGFTAEQILRILASVAAGQTDIIPGVDNTAVVKFRDLNDTLDRITVDMDGSERINVEIH